MTSKVIIKKPTVQQQLLKFQSIRICLASPDRIKQWAQQANSPAHLKRGLKNKKNISQTGQVINPKTFNYKNLKPEKGGLFCERIFGSLKNSQSRRYKLGYIQLVLPVTHVWYLKGSTSYISIILNIKKKKLEAVTYCSKFLSTHIKSVKFELTEKNISSLMIYKNCWFNENIRQNIDKNDLPTNFRKRSLVGFTKSWVNFISFDEYFITELNKIDLNKVNNVGLLGMEPNIRLPNTFGSFLKQYEQTIKNNSNNQTASVCFGIFLLLKNKKLQSTEVFLVQQFSKMFCEFLQFKLFTECNFLICHPINIQILENNPCRIEAEKTNFLSSIPDYLSSQSLVNFYNQMNQFWVMQKRSTDSLAKEYELKNKHANSFPTCIKLLSMHKQEGQTIGSSTIKAEQADENSLLRGAQSLSILRHLETQNYIYLSDLIINLIQRRHFNNFCFSVLTFQTILKFLTTDFFSETSKQKQKQYLTNFKQFNHLPCLIESGEHFISTKKLSSFVITNLQTSYEDQNIDLIHKVFRQKKQNILSYQFDKILNSSFDKGPKYEITDLYQYLLDLKWTNKQLQKLNFEKQIFISVRYKKLISLDENNMSMPKNPLGNKKFRAFLGHKLNTSIKKSLLIGNLKNVSILQQQIRLNVVLTYKQALAQILKNSKTDASETIHINLTVLKCELNSLNTTLNLIVLDSKINSILYLLTIFNPYEKFAESLNILKKSIYSFKTFLKLEMNKSAVQTLQNVSFESKFSTLSIENLKLKNKISDHVFDFANSLLNLNYNQTIFSITPLIYNKKLFCHFYIDCFIHKYENTVFMDKILILNDDKKSSINQQKVTTNYEKQLKVKTNQLKLSFDKLNTVTSVRGHKYPKLITTMSELMKRYSHLQKSGQKADTNLFLNSFILQNYMNIESSEMIQKLKNFLMNQKPIYKNKYYTIAQSFMWSTPTDWTNFLNYMTALAEKDDKIIPCYWDRGICFDLPVTGGIAVKNLLLNLNCKQLPTFETKTIRPQLLSDSLKQRNSNPFSNIELLISQIKTKILICNQQIQHYEHFLKFRAFFIKQKNQNVKRFNRTRIKNIQTQNGGQPINKTFQKLKKLRALRAKYFRRLKMLRPFQKQKICAEWMVLEVLPVLPPDLRPILVLDSQQVAVSDLTKLYQKVLFRNERLKRLAADFYCLNISPEMRYAQRLLQEAVDALIENGKADSIPITASNNRALKSLSDMVKGKKGRFRQNLLGKRVDYSGRSVIIVGPQLKLYECGLPKEMAIELFQPFLIRFLITKKITKNFISAKKLIKSKAIIVFEVLKQIMANRPILLNRAPTLHRLGIQAFKPKLVSGRAILLHPLVCSAYNADFDGDQMAVHVPLSYQACSEAWKIMWSRNNILSPATGEPIITPSQDMVLGCYYLTTLDKIKRAKYLTQNYKTNTKQNLQQPIFENLIQNAQILQNQNGLINQKNWMVFNTIDQVIQLFSQQFINCHTSIWLKWSDEVEFQIQNQTCLELYIDKLGNLTKIYSEYQTYFNKKQNYESNYIKTTPGRVYINKIIYETTCSNK